MGRASNRKKIQRQTGGPNLRRIKQDARSRAPAADRRGTALWAWSGDAEPVSAEMPPWPEGSLGHRLLTGTPLGEARYAPSLLTAQVPAAATITASPAHWIIATKALIRAVVFDGLTLDHPKVSALLEALTPVARAELAYARAKDDDRREAELLDDDDDPYVSELDPPDYPESAGPVFRLGRALVEALWTAAGEDSPAEVFRVLDTVLDGAVPGLDAETLTGVLLEAGYIIGDMPVSDNPLEVLFLDEEAEPGDILPIGLLMLSALARLCQSDAVSILERTSRLRTNATGMPPIL